MKKILLVEDDPDIYRLLSLHLTAPEYALEVWDTGMDAYTQIASNHFDLLLLDLVLPDVNGLEICKAVRRHNAQVPVIMLSGKNGEADKLAAFAMGADDYITKPFGIPELLARMKAVLRRSQNGPEEAIGEALLFFQEITIDRNKKKVSLRDERLDLTPKEFDLLCLLAANPGKAFSRQQLLASVWGIAFAGYEHTVTAHINRLRMKIEPNPTEPEYILTAWGTGYRFAE